MTYRESQSRPTEISYFDTAKKKADSYIDTHYTSSLQFEPPDVTQHIVHDVLSYLDSAEIPIFEARGRHTFIVYGLHNRSRDSCPESYESPFMVSVKVVSAGQPYAQSFPDNTIYIHTGLLSRDEPYGLQSTAELVGVMAHELAHLYNRDVLWQWAKVGLHNSQQQRDMASLVSTLAPFRYTYARDQEYLMADVFDKWIEYHADLQAVSAMHALGYNPAAYLAVLNRLKQYADKNPHEARQEPLNWINDRVACLGQLLHPTPFDAYRQPMPLTADANLQVMSPIGQFYMCAAGAMILDRGDAENLRHWLRAPGERSFTNILDAFDKRQRLAFTKFIAGIAIDTLREQGEHVSCNNKTSTIKPE